MKLARLIALFAAILAFLAPISARAIPVAQAEVTRVDGDRFTLDYRFEREAPVWVFRRSNVSMDDQQAWRPRSWIVQTPGVELVQVGRHMALVAADGGPVPARVRIAFTPFTGMLEKDYVPALQLGPDSVSLFSDHFEIVPATSKRAAEALDEDLSGVKFEAMPIRFVADDGEGLLSQGRRRSAVIVEKPTYVTFGPARPVLQDGIVAIVDPALPEWLRARLETQLPLLFALYGDRLGPRKDTTPQLLVGWVGGTPGVVSMGGSVVGDTVVLRLEGEGLVTPTPTEFHNILRFLAHEVAHFWVGETVAYGDSGSAWVAEGGADLLALRTAQRLDPTYDPRPYIETAFAECAKFLANGPLVEASARGDYRAFYDCGTTFSLVAEAGATGRGSDFFGWWRGMIARNRKAGEVNGATWLAGVARTGTDRRAVALMRKLALEGSRRPTDDLYALLKLGGVDVSRDPEGAIRLR